MARFRARRDSLQTTRAVKRRIQRPIVGFILSLIGGLFSVAGGLHGLGLTGPSYYSSYQDYQTYGGIGFGAGIVILTGAALLYLVPEYRVGWGILVLVAGVASVFSLFAPVVWFAIFGIPFALVGGSLGIAWNPAGPGLEDYRTCLTCGRHVRAEYPVCPFCGARVSTPFASSAPPPPP